MPSATALEPETRSAVDHPPFARAYAKTGNSVLLACVWLNSLPPGTKVTISYSGNGAGTTHEGTVDAGGHVIIEVPIFFLGVYSWSIVSAELPDGTVLSSPGGIKGGNSGTVGPSENPNNCDME